MPNIERRPSVDRLETNIERNGYFFNSNGELITPESKVEKLRAQGISAKIEEGATDMEGNPLPNYVQIIVRS